MLMPVKRPLTTRSRGGANGNRIGVLVLLGAAALAAIAILAASLLFILRHWCWACGG